MIETHFAPYVSPPSSARSSAESSDDIATRCSSRDASQQTERVAVNVFLHSPLALRMEDEAEELAVRLSHFLANSVGESGTSIAAPLDL